jgi:hypothetical protein
MPVDTEAASFSRVDMVGVDSVNLMTMICRSYMFSVIAVRLARSREARFLPVSIRAVIERFKLREDVDGFVSSVLVDVVSSADGFNR